MSIIMFYHYKVNYIRNSTIFVSRCELTLDIIAHAYMRR